MTILNYAMLKNSIVENIIVLEDPSETTIQYFKDLHEVDDIIIAGENCFLGSEYDNETFWNSKPYPSWIKDYQLKSWKAPVEHPEDGNLYSWNEETTSWKIADQSDLERMENI
jgi:hypothetical protein